jgi:hypothetical protein
MKVILPCFSKSITIVDGHFAPLDKRCSPVDLGGRINTLAGMQELGRTLQEFNSEISHIYFCCSEKNSNESWKSIRISVNAKLNRDVALRAVIPNFLRLFSVNLCPKITHLFW